MIRFAKKVWNMTEANNQIAIYIAENGQTQLDVRVQDETVWLTQEQMSLLFGTDRSAITKHIKNIIKDGELAENATCAKIAQVQPLKIP